MSRIYKNLLRNDVFASTKTRMDIVFDPAKDAANIAKHGLSLADFAGFDRAPLVREDDRYDYGETRLQAFGLIDGKPHVVVFTIRNGAMRVISFRRAHAKEGKSYGKASPAP